jgi:peroxiredoxin
MIAFGQTLPDWSLSSLTEGEAVPAFEDWNGSPRLLLFYSIGCPGCKARALPFARNLQADWAEGRVIGIHTRFEGPEYSPRQVEEINQVYRLNFPVFLDKGHQTYDLYGAEGTPHWLLVDSEGRLLKSLFGSMPNTLQRVDLSIQEL